MDNARLIALIVKHLCTLLLFALPAMWCYFLFDPSPFQMLAQERLRLPLQLETIESWQWRFSILLSAIPSAFVLWGVVYLRRTFTAFSEGAFFIPDNILNMRRFALSLVLSGALRPIIFSAISVLLSINHGNGEKILSVRIGSNEIQTIAVGLIFWVVASLLAKGWEIEQENRDFV